MLTLLRPQSGYMGQAKVTVSGNHFASERFSAGKHSLNPRTDGDRRRASTQRRCGAIIGSHGKQTRRSVDETQPLGG